MDRRKELIRQYKDNPPPAGVYQIRNTTNGKVFVAGAMDVRGKMNSQRFQLQSGSHMNKALQADWNAHTPDGFAFEVLETLAPEAEASPLAVRRALAELERKWLDAILPYGDRGYNNPPAAG